MSNLSTAFVTKFHTEVSHALSTQGSLLRDQVWTINGVVGSAVRFPKMNTATSEKNPPLLSPIAGDSADMHDNATATLNRYRTALGIDSLQMFETNIDVRSGYSMEVANALGRDMDAEILGAVKASNTSAGASAALDMARISKITALTYQYKWNRGGKRTFVITPAVYEKLIQITQFGDNRYNSGEPLKEGAPVRFMGWDWVIHPELAASTYWNSATDHNCYAFFDRAVGLGVGQDIKATVGWREDSQAWQVAASGLFGAVTILPNGVLKVGVNGL